MSRQIAFYANADDERILREAAAEAGARTLPNIVPVGDEIEPGSPLSSQVAEPGGWLYLLVPGVEVDDVAFEPMDDGRRLLVDSSSPVIQFLPSAIHSPETLIYGRFYLAVDPAHPLYDTVRPVYDALARIVRRWPRANEPGTYYVGPATLEEARRGDAPLVPTEVR